MPEIIASTKNPKVKALLSLQKSSNRRRNNRIVIEGTREIQKALLSGLELPSVFVCEDFLEDEGSSLVGKIKSQSILPVSDKVFNHIAYRKDSGGMIAIGIPRSLPLTDLEVHDNSIYVVLESVEKPGNLGAILRTTDAAGINGIIICDPKTDIYNPNVIRSSLGCVFTNSIAIASAEETAQWLSENQVTSFAAHLAATKSYYDEDYGGKVAIVMGTESDGLTDFWVDNANHMVKIPMKGSVDSMNVAVSTAILLFEIVRQRSHNG